MKSDHLSYADDCDSESAINISHNRFKNVGLRNQMDSRLYDTGMASILNRVVSQREIDNNMLARPSQTTLVEKGKRIKSAVGERKPAGGVQFRQLSSANNITSNVNSSHVFHRSDNNFNSRSTQKENKSKAAVYLSKT